MKVAAILLTLLLLVIIPLANAEPNDCEKLAKDYQKAHYGDLVLIQPLKKNGAYDLGEYNGHWINKAYSKDRGIYYHDSQTGSYLKSESEVLEWYEWQTGKKAELFNVNKEGAPFGIIYHY